MVVVSVTNIITTRDHNRIYIISSEHHQHNILIKVVSVAAYLSMIESVTHSPLDCSEDHQLNKLHVEDNERHPYRLRQLEYYKVLATKIQIVTCPPTSLFCGHVRSKEQLTPLCGLTCMTGLI